jgi:hypothetical protein
MNITEKTNREIEKINNIREEENEKYIIENE